MKVFELKNINYSYFNNNALVDINLDINSEEKIAILGPNGCGKTTLLSLLNGLIFANSGLIKFMGKELTEKNLEDPEFNSYFRQKVGYVFQNPDIHLFCPTVKDELYFGPDQLKLDRKTTEEQVDKTIDFFNLEKLLDRAIFSLSYGEKKRVSIASVFVLNPEIILLDEPTTGLDPKNKNLLISLLDRLNSDRKTIITATHDLQIIDKISDRIVLFNEKNTIINSDATNNMINDTTQLINAGLF